MDINDNRVSRLLNVVETVRRRKISDSDSSNIVNYIDPSNYLEKLCIPNNHIVQGRRGSGKTTLLMRRIQMSKNDELSIMIDCQPIKKYNGTDITIYLLLNILKTILTEFDDENLKKYTKETKLFWRIISKISKTQLEKINQAKYFLTIFDMVQRLIISINKIQNMPDILRISAKQSSNSKTERASLLRSSGRFHGKTRLGTSINYYPQVNLFGEAFVDIESMIEATEEFSELETIESSKEIIEERIVSKKEIIDKTKYGISKLFNEFHNFFNKRIVLYLDDYYLLTEEDQIQVIHYLHDIYKVSINSSFCFKLSVLPHRIKINPEGNYDLSIKDDFSPIRLDYDLADFENLKKNLLNILVNLEEDLDLTQQDIRSCYTNDDASNYSVIASGGIPRDFIVLFADLIVQARNDGRNTISKENIYAIVNELKNEKDQNIEMDSDISPERIRMSLMDITSTVVERNKTNVFLYPQQRTVEEENILRNLVNLRYIHPIKENISSENVKKRMFDAFLVDMSFYATRQRMPKEFNFREFWVQDKAHRLPELHRSPILQFSAERDLEA